MGAAVSGQDYRDKYTHGQIKYFGNYVELFEERGQSRDQWFDNVESGNLLKTNAETKECTMADVENDEMIDVDENNKIENVNLDLDQGDCVGHVGGVIGGGVSLCVCVCVWGGGSGRL